MQMNMRRARRRSEVVVVVPERRAPTISSAYPQRRVGTQAVNVEETEWI
jgi:hypothetical protein